jgi:glycosyltransferase involved in cell wall biosynthesis
MRSRPTVLIICDYYLPGFESGGAARTLANMVERLGNRYEFYLITRDRDGVAVNQSYTTVDIGEWNDVGCGKVYYLRPDQVRPGHLSKLINEVGPDVVYVNSFFSRLTMMYFVLNRLGLIGRRPLVIAPEGEFSPGALSLGRAKKSAYIRVVKALGLTAGAVWKAAGQPERKYILQKMGSSTAAMVAPNMPPQVIFPEFDPDKLRPKQSGSARIVFLSRFMRMKNFNYLMPIFKNIKGDVTVDIWGTLEEPEYWEQCRRLVAELPAGKQVTAKGPVPHESVQQTMFEYDFFVLPTLGESFGHVFIEAFSSGLPVIASDRSPWRGLDEKQIGWDLSLDAPAGWEQAIQTAVDMDADEHRRMRLRARAYAVDWLSDPDIEQSNAAVLDAALRAPNG